MTPEQAQKIVTYLSARSAPKPSQEQKDALQKDLLKFEYNEKILDNIRSHSVSSSWFPVISQIAPSPEVKPFKQTFKPGIKGKAGIKIAKQAIERTSK